MRLLNKIKNLDWTQLLIYSVIAVIVLGVLTCGGISIYCWCVYGGKPVGEIPTWALWFMFGGGR